MEHGFLTENPSLNNQKTKNKIYLPLQEAFNCQKILNSFGNSY